jgi:tetratricopeptide (TPR) repeat protein
LQPNHPESDRLLGLAALREGQYQAADSTLERGQQFWSQLGAETFLPYFKYVHAEARAALSDTTSAFQLIDEALDQINRPEWEERSHLAEVLRVRGLLYEQVKKPESAEESFRASLDLARKQQAKS